MFSETVNTLTCTGGRRQLLNQTSRRKQLGYAHVCVLIVQRPRPKGRSQARPNFIVLLPSSVDLRKSFQPDRDNGQTMHFCLRSPKRALYSWTIIIHIIKVHINVNNKVQKNFGHIHVLNFYLLPICSIWQLAYESVD